MSLRRIGVQKKKGIDGGTEEGSDAGVDGLRASEGRSVLNCKGVLNVSWEALQWRKLFTRDGQVPYVDHKG